MMNRVQVGQKRAGTPLTNQIVKQRQAMPAQRNTRPAQAKDVKEKIHKTGRVLSAYRLFLPDSRSKSVRSKTNFSKSFRSLPIKKFKLKSFHQNWQRKIMTLNIMR